MKLQESIQRDGYIFISEYKANDSDIDVAKKLGKLSSFQNTESVHHLTPCPSSAPTLNTYSGIFGCRNFPFHSDLAHWKRPPRYLFLRCVTGFKEVHTLILDGLDIVKNAGSIVLSPALVQPRRPIGGKLSLLSVG
jgi:hypothetical protein